MQIFTYTARDLKSGQKITADVEAENEPAAARLLSERGLAPLDIQLKKEESGLQAFFSRIPTKQMVVFSRELATLVNSGLPLVQSLEAVKNQTANKKLKVIVGRVINDVEAGSTLANAMAAHPKVFDQVYTSLVAAGEASGTLDVSLDRLANQKEKDSETVARIRGAMLYPLMVIIVLIGVVIFLLTSVLPQVESLYAGLPDARLPFVTRLLLSLSNFLISFWWLAFLIVGGSTFAAVRWLRTNKGIAFYDRFKMRAPAIGPLFMKLYMARFARVSATLISSGIPLIQVLNTAAKSVGNVHIEAAVLRAAESVKGGKPLSDSITGDEHFLELVPNMLRTGEQSGSLDTMMSKLADYYEKEVDGQIKSISTVIEPIMMIAVGIIALIIVAAVLLPIYSLAGKDFLRL